MKLNTKFETDDHRKFNRHGESFDRGETFSGVDYRSGLEAVEEIKSLVPHSMTLTQFALRWILMFDAVTCAIPGAKTPAQAEENFGAADFPALSKNMMSNVKKIYDEQIRELVHHNW